MKNYQIIKFFLKKKKRRLITFQEIIKIKIGFKLNINHDKNFIAMTI